MLNYSVCIYIYTDAVRFLVGVQNSTARRTGRLRFVQIAADHRAGHLRWACEAVGSVRRRPVSSVPVGA